MWQQVIINSGSRLICSSYGLTSLLREYLHFSHRDHKPLLVQRSKQVMATIQHRTKNSFYLWLRSRSTLKGKNILWLVPICERIQTQRNSKLSLAAKNAYIFEVFSIHLNSAKDMNEVFPIRPTASISGLIKDERINNHVTDKPIMASYEVRVFRDARQSWRR